MPLRCTRDRKGYLDPAVSLIQPWLRTLSVGAGQEDRSPAAELSLSTDVSSREADVPCFGLVVCDRVSQNEAASVFCMISVEDISRKPIGGETLSELSDIVFRILIPLPYTILHSPIFRSSSYSPYSVVSLIEFSSGAHRHDGWRQKRAQKSEPASQTI